MTSGHISPQPRKSPGFSPNYSIILHLLSVASLLSLPVVQESNLFCLVSAFRQQLLKIAFSSNKSVEVAEAAVRHDSAISDTALMELVLTAQLHGLTPAAK